MLSLKKLARLDLEDTEQEFKPLSRYAPIFQEWLRRLKENRDVRIIVTAKNSETGTGKTTLALWLALSFDKYWNPEKAALSMKEYVEKYQVLPRGSVLLFDECHQVDNRRSMNKTNIDLSRVWMTMRVRQICTIFTTPTMTVVDKRLKELADFRIHVERRGLAIVNKIQVNKYDGSIWEDEWHAIEFPNLDWHPYKKKLDLMKEQLIEQLIDEIEEQNIPKNIKKTPWFKIGKEVQKFIEKGLTREKAIVHVATCRDESTNFVSYAHAEYLRTKMEYC